ncbi:MAG: MEDS domain-containing protein [Gemmatimonadota bacterium]
MAESENELLDIEQAARFLNVSETSLRRWTNSGRLPCLRIGQRRERRFRKADLIAFMEAQPGSVREARDPAESASAATHHHIKEGDHVCGLYTNDISRLKMAVSFLADGQRPGTFTYVIGKDEACQPILLHLERRRPELQKDVANHSLVACNYQGSAKAQLEYFAEEFAAAIRNGATSIRLLGDVTALNQTLTTEDIREYELGYDELIARRFPIATMCQYDVRAFSGVGLVNALKCHPDSLRYPPRLWLA